MVKLQFSMISPKLHGYLTLDQVKYLTAHSLNRSLLLHWKEVDSISQKTILLSYRKPSYNTLDKSILKYDVVNPSFKRIL